ncbi:ImmA/IrrE family metallo-endopeptidase [Acinetobacter stercoris]|uniref:IrrE N-terminal-like domain-containing protein n=1 Tax=Acinetobacter stercoris TaxID=2126983 RepID=A0A2U3MV50_9GAMM|nr:ImmA/IrrE family metallo-endopeptidase [Acinetobacter stercoris]SPL69317.1 hypothetical protein KPC_0495 [Acinetobacter stercoris]
MIIELVKHSPDALKRYMTDMNVSASELANLTKISINKINKALDDTEVFRLSQLENISKALFVPTVYLTTNDFFYERNTPEIIEFRNHQDIPEEKYKENALIQEFCQVRDNFISILDSLNEEPKPFDLKLGGIDAEEDAQSIIDYFGFYSHSKKTKNQDDYFNSWRDIVELMDVVVIDRGREKFGSDGMCLYFDTAPIIAIFSSGQSQSRKLFTLIHELVHLGLGNSVFDGRLLESNHTLERYCDKVAGYVLAPKNIVNNCFNENLTIEENVVLIRKKTKASKAAIAIQLKMLGLINQDQLTDYLDYIKPKESSGGFGSKKENMVLKYFGYSFVEKVMSAMWQERISSNTAKDILGFHKTSKPAAFKELQQKVF